MYPVEVEVDSVPPPLASVVQSTTDQDSASSSSTRTSTRRIQPIPIQVNTVENDVIFPPSCMPTTSLMMIMLQTCLSSRKTS
jgi:hypothetical protein